MSTLPLSNVTALSSGSRPRLHRQLQQEHRFPHSLNPIANNDNPLALSRIHPTGNLLVKVAKRSGFWQQSEAKCTVDFRPPNPFSLRDQGWRRRWESNPRMTVLQTMIYTVFYTTRKVLPLYCLFGLESEPFRAVLLRRDAPRYETSKEDEQGQRSGEMPGAFQDPFPAQGRIPLDGGEPPWWEAKQEVLPAR